MVYHHTLEFKRLLTEAKDTLGQQFSFFKTLIYTYNIKKDSPFWDIACYLTLLKLEELQKNTEGWIKYWKKHSSKRDYKNLIYQVPDSYLYFILNDTKEKLFYKILKQFKDSKNLTWKNYFDFFFNLRSNLFPHMKTNEKNVFIAILENQSESTSLIADALNMNQTNVSKYKKELFSRFLIFKGISLNHVKLNLSIHSIIGYTSLENNIQLEELLKKNPFFHSIYYNDIGYRSFLINFLAPNHFLVLNDLLKYADFLKEKYNLTEVKILKCNSKNRFRSFNYTSYDPKKREWDFNSNDIFFNYSRKNMQKDDPTKFRLFSDFEYQKLKIDKETLDILFELNFFPSSSPSEISKKLGFSLNKVKKIIKYLIENQLVKFRYSPSPIFGLSSVVLSLKIAKIEQGKLHQFFSILPEVFSMPYIEYSNSLEQKSKGITFIFRVSSKMLVNFIENIKNTFEGQIEDLLIVSKMFSKRWYLPSHKFHTVFKEWTYKKGEFLSYGDD